MPCGRSWIPFLRIKISQFGHSCRITDSIVSFMILSPVKGIRILTKNQIYLSSLYPLLSFSNIIINRSELFARNLCQRVQASSGTACQNNTFHNFSPLFLIIWNKTSLQYFAVNQLLALTFDIFFQPCHDLYDIPHAISSFLGVLRHFALFQANCLSIVLSSSP